MYTNKYSLDWGDDACSDSTTLWVMQRAKNLNKACLKTKQETVNLKYNDSNNNNRLPISYRSQGVR